MLIDNQFREKYYLTFVKKATLIIGATLNTSVAEAKDLAKDFTSAFLYSRSLMSTFNSSKGDVEPFFSSWVRKTISSYSRSESQWRSFKLLEDWMRPSTSGYHPYDFIDWFQSIVDVLGGREWVSGDTVIPYSRVFKAASLQVLTNDLWGDKVRYNELARVLSIKPVEAKNAYLSLTEILHDKRSKGVI